MSTFVSVSNLFSKSVRSQILAFYLRGGQLRKIGVLKKLNLRPFEFLSACNAFVLLPHKETGDKLLSISASLVFINPITHDYMLIGTQMFCTLDLKLMKLMSICFYGKTPKLYNCSFYSTSVWYIVVVIWSMRNGRLFFVRCASLI